MEIVTRVHANNLVRWAAPRPEVLVLSADLTSSTEIDLFRDTYPQHRSPDRVALGDLDRRPAASTKAGLGGLCV